MYPARRYNRTPTNRTQNIRSTPVNPFLEYKKETTQSISDILNELKTVKTKFHTENNGLKKYIFNLEETISTLEQSIFSLTQKTTTLENQISTQAAHTTTLENQISTQAAHTTTLENQISTQAAHTTTLENQISTQAAHTTTLENQISTQAAHTTTLENQISTQAAHTTTLENQISTQAAHTTTLENQISTQADHLKMIDDALVKLNTLEEGNNLFETFINDYTLKHTDLTASHDIYKSRVDDIMSKENTNTCSILEGIANVNKDNTSNILLLLERLITQQKEQSSTTSVLIQNLKSPKEERYSSNLTDDIKDECTPLKDNTEASLPTTDDQVETTISDDTPKKRKYIRKKH